MLNGLLHSHPRPLLVLEHSQRERERSCLFLYLAKDLSRGLHLELIIHLGVAFVDGRPALLGLRLAVCARGDEDVDPPYFSLFKRLGLVVPTLLGGGVEDDSFLAIGDVLLMGAREHTLDGDTTVVLGDGLDDVGDGKVLQGGFDRSHLPGWSQKHETG